MERPGLTERADLDAVELHLVHHPFRAWAIALVLLAIVGRTAATESALWQAFWVGLLVLAFGADWWERRHPPRATVRIAPAQVAVHGWTGRWPLPRRRTLPLLGATVGWRRQGRLRRTRLWRLWIARGDDVVVVPAVMCTEEELAGLRRRVAEMQDLAATRHGEGANEVPEALRRVSARVPRDSA